VCVLIAATSRIRRLTISLLLWRGWQIPADGEKKASDQAAARMRYTRLCMVYYPYTSRCIRRHYNYRLKPLQLPGSALSGRPPEHRTHRAQMIKGIIIGARRGGDRGRRTDGPTRVRVVCKQVFYCVNKIYYLGT